MEKFVRQSLLFDFYGELLTEHQKKIYGEIIVDDLSYAEVARDEGISRQGIYDLMKRCDKILEEYENTLHLVEKFENTKKMVAAINTCANEMSQINDNQELNQYIEKIVTISNSILEEY